MNDTTKATATLSVHDAAMTAAELFAEEFPGEPLDLAWLGAAWEIDSTKSGCDWGDDYCDYERVAKARHAEILADARAQQG